MDGHEREDVVKSREEFLKKVEELKDDQLPPPPCSDERAATPPPDTETRKKLVLIYHDESIFNTNEGQTWMWATEDAPILQPKTKGSGIMESDFIDQHSGVFFNSQTVSMLSPKQGTHSSRKLQGCCSSMEWTKKDIGRVKSSW